MYNYLKLLLVSFLIFAFHGCGGNDQAPASGESSRPTESSVFTINNAIKSRSHKNSECPTEINNNKFCKVDSNGSETTNCIDIKFELNQNNELEISGLEDQVLPVEVNGRVKTVNWSSIKVIMKTAAFCSDDTVEIIISNEFNKNKNDYGIIKIIPRKDGSGIDILEKGDSLKQGKYEESKFFLKM